MAEERPGYRPVPLADFPRFPDAEMIARARRFRTPSPMGFLRGILGRPDHERPVMIVVTGRPAEDAVVPDLARKPLAAITSWL
ncbi:MAG: hypothetical protein KatS3mg119_0354 [Rhodothalassiaceae bacterium]|nr:MAG: hypothetical protein KatS3mg119_0354 [Rhodothalassiaceae bacterium]